MMKKMLLVLLAAAMLLCAGSAMAETVSAQYVERRWEDGVVKAEEKTASSCTVVESTDSGYDVYWGSGWYVVTGNNVVIRRQIHVNGDVHLILADGAKLTMTNGIVVSNFTSLTIYGQSEGTGELDADGVAGCAGIGGDTKDSRSGNVTIHGGTITASGRTRGAGIGGGGSGDIAGEGGRVTIYAGTVTATGSLGGAGIGGGKGGDGGTVTIYGGTVNATGVDGGAGIGGGSSGEGSSVTIYGGTVNATGGNLLNDEGKIIGGGAGIGGGSSDEANWVTISGGTVTATGGYGGAGIGGGSGSSGKGDAVTITGGTVTATGGEGGGAGIGGGRNGNGGSTTGRPVKITGGTITATGNGGGAGIGGGYSGNGGTVKIDGGNVKAVGSQSAKDIGRGSGGDENGALSNTAGAQIYEWTFGSIPDLKNYNYYNTTGVDGIEGKYYFWLPLTAEDVKMTLPADGDYTGKPYSATAVFKVGDLSLPVVYRKSPNGSWRTDAPVDAGTYEVGVRPEGGSVIENESWEFTIGQKPLYFEIKPEDSGDALLSKVYDGNVSVTEAYELYITGLCEGETVKTKMSLVYESADACDYDEAAGAYETKDVILNIELSGSAMANYTYVATDMFHIGVIEPMDLSACKVSVPDMTETGWALYPKVQIIGANGQQLVEGVDFTLSTADGEAALDELIEPGQYTLEITGMGNYKGVLQETFEILEGNVLVNALFGEVDSGYDDAQGQPMQIRLQPLGEVHKNLVPMFPTAQAIEQELDKQTKACGFLAEQSMMLEASLGRMTDNGWEEASDEEHEKVGRVTVSLELGSALDLTQYEFLTAHMFEHGERIGETEIIREHKLRQLKPELYELSFEMTGLSPVMISLKAKPPVAAGELPETGDPSMLGAWALLLGASAMGLGKMKKKS